MAVYYLYPDSSNKPARSAGDFLSLKVLGAKICNWKAYHIARPANSHAFGVRLTQFPLFSLISLSSHAFPLFLLLKLFATVQSSFG